MDEQGNMDTEDLYEWAAEIFNHFEPVDLDRHKERDLTLFGIIEWMTRHDVDFLCEVLRKSELKLEGKNAYEVFCEFWGEVIMISFAIGFSMGKWKDCPDPDIRKKIEQVQTDIQQRGLFHCRSKARA